MECDICNFGLNKQNRIPIALGCLHTFCFSCLEDWKKIKNTCPVCREPITSETPNYYLIGLLDKKLIVDPSSLLVEGDFNSSNNSDNSKGFQLSQNNGKYFNDLGYSSALICNYDQAVDCYNKAIELNPNDATAFYNKGLCFHSKENYQEAIECYDKAIQLDPNNQYFVYNKGIALAKLDDNHSAINCFETAIKLNPN